VADFLAGKMPNNGLCLAQRTGSNKVTNKQIKFSTEYQPWAVMMIKYSVLRATFEFELKFANKSQQLQYTLVIKITEHELMYSSNESYNAN
jgi:hypothetical protein